MESALKCLEIHKKLLHPLPEISGNSNHSYFDNIMTKFMINNRTEAWKTERTKTRNSTGSCWTQYWDCFQVTLEMSSPRQFQPNESKLKRKFDAVLEMIIITLQFKGKDYFKMKFRPIWEELRRKYLVTFLSIKQDNGFEEAIVAARAKLTTRLKFPGNHPLQSNRMFF